MLSTTFLLLCLVCWILRMHSPHSHSKKERKNDHNNNNNIHVFHMAYLNVFPYVINLFEPSKETSSTEWWFELAAPLIIGFLMYGGSYLADRVVFLLCYCILTFPFWLFHSGWGESMWAYVYCCHHHHRSEAHRSQTHLLGNRKKSMNICEQTEQTEKERGRERKI